MYEYNREKKQRKTDKDEDELSIGELSIGKIAAAAGNVRAARVRLILLRLTAVALDYERNADADAPHVQQPFDPPAAHCEPTQIY